MRPGAPSRIFQNTPKPPLFAQSGRKLFNTKKIGNFLQAESPSPLSVSTVVRAIVLAALYISPVQIFWQLSFSKNQGQGQVFRNSPEPEGAKKKKKKRKSNPKRKEKRRVFSYFPAPLPSAHLRLVVETCSLASSPLNCALRLAMSSA